MSIEYQSELHTLCAQSKWVELSSILNSILDNNSSGDKPSHQNEATKNNLLQSNNAILQQQTPNSRLITPGATSTSHTISTAPPSSSAYNDGEHGDSTPNLTLNRKDSHTTHNSTSTTEHINSHNKSNSNNNNNNIHNTPITSTSWPNAQSPPSINSSFKSFNTDLKCSYEKLEDEYTAGMISRGGEGMSRGGGGRGGEELIQVTEEDLVNVSRDFANRRESFLYSSEEGGCDRKSSTPKKDNKGQHEEDSDANDSLGSFSSADDDISFSSESSVNTQEEMDDMLSPPTSPLEEMEDRLLRMSTIDDSKAYYDTSSNRLFSNEHGMSFVDSSQIGFLKSPDGCADEEDNDGEGSYEGSPGRHGEEGESYAGSSTGAASVSSFNAQTPINEATDMSKEQTLQLKAQLLKREGSNKYTPLHICCTSSTTPAHIISLLIKCNSKSCEVPDRNGNLPLHLLCSHKRSQQAEKTSEGCVPSPIKIPNLHGSEEYLRRSTQSTDCSGQLASISEGGDKHQNELCQIIYQLISALPVSLATVNRWGQTPLHCLFDNCSKGFSSCGDLLMIKTILGKWDEEMCTNLFKEQPLLSIKCEVKSAVSRSLKHRDTQGRLPLHCAADCSWVNEDILRLLVGAFPEAVCIPVLPPFDDETVDSGEDGHDSRNDSESYDWDITRNAVIPESSIDGLFPKTGGCYDKDLAVHLLHRRLVSPLVNIEDDHDLLSKTSGVSGHTNVSVYLKRNHCGLISALLEPLVEAAVESEVGRLACAATGSSSSTNKKSKKSAVAATNTLLPIHIAALHGVSFTILEGLCRAYPEGVVTPMISSLHTDRMNTLPIELFEEGRAGHEVNVASDSQFVSLSVDYFRRSDLLFSYFPEAKSSKGVVYCRDEARLSRFEQLIRSEACCTDSEGLLSDMAGSVWLFLCRSSTRPSSRSSRRSSTVNFGAVIGRILEGLEPHSVLRLNFMRTKSTPEGVRVPTLANGRTILEEAKERSPNGSMSSILEENFFNSSVLSYLDVKDALSYSATCRKAWTRGVRLLRQIPNKTDTMDTHGKVKLTDDCCASETSSQWRERGGKVSQQWQKLALPIVPRCTHTVFITCDIKYQSWRGEDSSCKGGGLFVVGEDSTTNGIPDLVVSYIPVKARNREKSIKFSFNHQPQHNYSLWYYGGDRHTLTVTNLIIRQLVYSCDRNGHNPLHVLLCEGGSNQKEQIQALFAAGFGSNLPIHYALKVDVPDKTLKSLIDARPASLLDNDEKKQTPLHSVFGSSSKIPSLGTIKTLLMSQGVNATHLKDSRGKLPLHLAAEQGASEDILQLLVDAYADGCYRRTDDGDIPLHLLVRSGSATQATVELFILPIIHNPTICSYPGSIGVNLPLHIACEYRCKQSIIEALLSSYGEAAETKRQLMQSDTNNKSAAEYALSIFEQGRASIPLTSSIKSDKKNKYPVESAELTSFNLRSDLLFVHNPEVPKEVRPYTTTYYKDEKGRIQRLIFLIKREAKQCIEVPDDETEDIELTDMAKLAWCWMCSNESYSEVVKDIVKALPIEAVRFLALVTNPKSRPVPDSPIKDCSAPRCALIIKSRLSFLGRYILDQGSAPLHKSESSVVLKAKDIGVVDSYMSIQSLLDESEPDIDDYSHACGSVYAITGNTIEVGRFTEFAQKLGLSEQEALASLETLMDEETNFKESGVKKSVFKEFCSLFTIDNDGCRSVVLKFIKSKSRFDLENSCRDILRDEQSLNVVPILNQFAFEENDKMGKSNDFIRDIYDGGPLLLNLDLSNFNYGIVMPAADGDLHDIFYRQGMNSSNIRENIRQVGETLQALHDQGITYMNLSLSSVLQYGHKMVLSDFGSALFLKSIEGNNAIGGSSQHSMNTSILPPEMITKFDLADKDSSNKFLKHWKYVQSDANYLRPLTPQERDAISQFVEAGDEQDWKKSISSLLETIKFEDLPRVLSKCASFNDFREIWKRMHDNLILWETFVRPRRDEKEQCMYMLKTYENRKGSPSRDASTLPYKLVPPSEKVDMWMFGVFIYELTSGGNPFHTGIRGDLRGVDSYSSLHGWSRADTISSVREFVQDPLAQDLLSQILVPSDERLPTIAACLKHPFFSPKSVEAELFLERNEEVQLIRQNTVTISQVTKAVSAMIDNSMEKYCRLAFATDQIAVPCCLMMLPYAVNMDETNTPTITSNDTVTRLNIPSPELITRAEKLGKYLLNINKATARLSFWLMMNAKMKEPVGNVFKAQLQDWLKRARDEPVSVIAQELIRSLGCNPNYVMICEEVLAQDGSVSKAKSYMRDPIRAAKREIKHNSDEIATLYQSSYLYLVNEATMLPSCPLHGETRGSYPIEVEPNPKLIVNVILPFMNIVVMKALARSGFDGLANLLGLPQSVGIPQSWQSSEPGLLHSLDDPSSIEEFVSLQSILRKDDLNEFKDDESVMSHSCKSYHSGISATFDNTSFLSISALRLTDIDLSPVDPAIAGIPMTQLELLFRDKDPNREFDHLKRITSKDKSTGLWTSIEGVQHLESMVEVAGLEDKLRELKSNLDQAKSNETEYASLIKMRRELKMNLPNIDETPLGQAFTFDHTFDEHMEHSQDDQDDTNLLPRDDLQDGQYLLQVPVLTSVPEEEDDEVIKTHKMPHRKVDRGDEAEKHKKMRKAKRRFRPWFTAC